MFANLLIAKVAHAQFTIKRDINREYENIEICDHKAATKTVDIEVNENPAYSIVKDL